MQKEKKIVNILLWICFEESEVSSNLITFVKY